jgi:histidine ammonia-lyase
MINGTQFITALGAEALYRAERVAIQADIVAALTLEALQGTHKAFDTKVSGRHCRGRAHQLSCPKCGPRENSTFSSP